MTSPIIAQEQMHGGYHEQSSGRRRVLVMSSTFPSIADPTYGVFVKERLRALADLPGYEIHVIAPVPYFPPIRRFERWYSWSQFPREEVVDGLPVHRPRYVLPPRVGGYVRDSLMLAGARKTATRLLEKGFDFDLIDAHFVFPNGAVAARLSRQFERPFLVTGRGEDILRFPDLPVMKSRIRTTLKRGSAFVALSREIADAFERHGANPERITVIPNGVDATRFPSVACDEARRKLDLPLDRPIVISAGNRQERKGFHLLIEAVPALRQQFPDVLVVILGGAPPYGKDTGPDLEERIHKHQLKETVRLVGRRPHEELHLWYAAADLFALMTSREGSPNVVNEALACGLPVVATSIGGIPDELEDPNHGIVLPERTTEAAEKGLVEGLRRKWDRPAIRQARAHRTWQATARRVAEVMDRVVEEGPREERSREDG